MFYKSIRFKIVLWYMGLLAITLLIFSTLVYQSFKKALYDDMDDLLSSRAEGIVNAITTYWDIEAMKHAHDANVMEEPSAEDNANFLKMASDWVMEKSKDPNLMSLYVRIRDPKRELLI